MNTLKLIDLYRSYRIRKSFIEHRDLLLKHERLLRIGRQKETGTAKAKIKKTDNDKKRVVHNAGSFLGNDPSSIYSWSIGHILEHEFFCLGHLGCAGSKEKKVDLSFSEQLLRMFFSAFCGQKKIKIFLKILSQPH